MEDGEVYELINQLAEIKALDFEFLEFEYNEQTGAFDPLPTDENDEIISLLSIFGQKCLEYYFSSKDDPNSDNNTEFNYNIEDELIEAEYFKSKEETSELICAIIIQRKLLDENDSDRIFELKENIISNINRFDAYIYILYNYFIEDGSQNYFFEHLRTFDF